MLSHPQYLSLADDFLVEDHSRARLLPVILSPVIYTYNNIMMLQIKYNHVTTHTPPSSYSYHTHLFLFLAAATSIQQHVFDVGGRFRHTLWHTLDN